MSMTREGAAETLRHIAEESGQAEARPTGVTGDAASAGLIDGTQHGHGRIDILHNEGH